MAISNKYVSADVVVERALRMFDNDTFDIHDAYEFIADGVAQLMPAEQLEVTTCTATVEDYRAAVPNDLVYFNAIRNTNSGRQMRPATDKFITHMLCDSSEMIHCGDCETFVYKPGAIFVPFETGSIDISYFRFPMDDNGMPMIPEDTVVLIALENYLIERMAYKMVISGKMSGDTYQLINREKDWAMTVAYNKIKTPSPQQAENLKNIYLRMIRDRNSFAKANAGQGAQNFVRTNINNNRTYGRG